MAYSKTIVADAVVQRLIETQGIYSFCNRSFDGLVRQGISSVDIPKLAIPVVKTAGTALVNTDRKKAKGDTNMVNVPLVAYAVPLAEEVLAAYESNGTLIKEYINSAALALQEKFDSLVITEAQTTTDIDDFENANLGWDDIINIMKTFDTNKVPKSGRIIIISAALAAEFFAIDVVKGAIQYNPNYLESGTFVNFAGMKFFISGLVPQINGKDSVIGISGPGLAFILNRMGEIKESYDTTNLQTVYDVLAHAGAKLLDSKFAVVRTKQ